MLRRKSAGPAGAFRAPFFPVIPLIFVVGELGVVAGSYIDPKTLSAALVGVAWILAATVLYYARFRNRDA
jgi:L-asparagine transporter-like permease